MEYAGLIKRMGADALQVAEELRLAGFLVLLLPSGIIDRAAFFDAVKTLVPLDPPLVSNRSWDALSDSLWGGLDQLAADRIAIVWPAVHVGASPELETAVSVLEDVSRSFADPSATAGNPKRVAVVIT